MKNDSDWRWWGGTETKITEEFKKPTRKKSYVEIKPVGVFVATFFFC